VGELKTGLLTVQLFVHLSDETLISEEFIRLILNPADAEGRVTRILPFEGISVIVVNCNLIMFDSKKLALLIVPEAFIKFAPNDLLGFNKKNIINITVVNNVFFIVIKLD
jgi:hypothetical protein